MNVVLPEDAEIPPLDSSITALKKSATIEAAVWLSARMSLDMWQKVKSSGGHRHAS